MKNVNNKWRSGKIDIECKQVEGRRLHLALTLTKLCEAFIFNVAFLKKVYQRQLLMKGWVLPGSPLSVDQKSYTIKNFLPYKINLELAHCVLLTVLLAVDCLVDS